MRDRLVEAVDDPDREDRGEIFGAPVLLGGRRRGDAGSVEQLPGRGAAAQLDPLVGLAARASRGSTVAAIVRATSNVSMVLHGE